MKPTVLTIVVVILIISSILFIMFKLNIFSKESSGSGSTAPMDRTAALEYAHAWAKKVNGEPDELVFEKNGDFYGTMDTSIAFEYKDSEKVLIVRAVVDPFASGLAEKRQDVMKELSRISERDPESVDHAQFELLLDKWQTRQEPSLYLRLDIFDQSLSHKQFTEKLNEFGDIAFVWNRNYFGSVVDAMNFVSKGEEKSQQYIDVIKKITSEKGAQSYNVVYEGSTNEVKYFQVPARHKIGEFYYLFDTSGKEILKVKETTLGDAGKDAEEYEQLTKDLYEYAMLVPETK